MMQPPDQGMPMPPQGPPAGGPIGGGAPPMGPPPGDTITCPSCGAQLRVEPAGPPPGAAPQGPPPSLRDTIGAAMGPGGP